MAFGSGSDAGDRGEQLGGRGALRPGTTVQIDRVGHDDAARGDGARLVQAERVDAGQELDRGQLAQQGLTTGQGDDAGHERQARQQDQPVGHHRDAGRDDSRQRLLPALPGAVQAPEQDRGDGRDQQHQEGQDAVDAPAQLGADQREPACFLGEAGRVGVGPDLLGPVGPRARRDEAARQHLVADRLVLGVGLAGQQRLVQLQAMGLDDPSVDDHLLARTQHEHVVQDDLLDLDTVLHAVPTDHGVRLGEHRQPVQRQRGPGAPGRCR